MPPRSELVPEPEPELEAAEVAEPELELDLPELEPREPEVEEPMLVLRGQAGSTGATEEEGVQALLAAKKLEKYTEAMAEQGYSFVDDLLEADADDIAKLAKDIQMKKPEAKRFLKVVAAIKSAAETSGGPDGGAPSCPICFELFGDGIVPRILVGCGHTFCECCMDKMLRPLPARGGRKVLGCPTCRKECNVPRGRAAELPINFMTLCLQG